MPIPVEYSAVVLDTPFQKYQVMLERVQSFAGRSGGVLQVMRLLGVLGGPH